jgi:hypothetical protein
MSDELDNNDDGAEPQTPPAQLPQHTHPDTPAPDVVPTWTNDDE